MLPARQLVETVVLVGTCFHVVRHDVRQHRRQSLAVCLDPGGSASLFVTSTRVTTVNSSQTGRAQ
jgi:hypothetical protein